MASSKKPTYKVETKLTTERKRRKSDLVLMWQSMMDVTAIVVKELWTTIIRLLEFIQIWFSSSERFLVQKWLEKYLPYVPEDFSESWRDGRLLAILLNKLQPGCFPDAYHLDPEYGLRNVYRVFDALEMYFGINPNVSVEEIVTCIDGSDAKLFAILLELKNHTDAEPENKDANPEHSENIESSATDQSCIVKGAGLAVGFVGKTSNFIIFCATMSDLDVVVEIRGPNTICSERITKRSPRKKSSVPSFECARHLARSTSLNENGYGLEPEEHRDFEKRIIPMEYEIISNQICLGYKPREKGKHKLTILWHGKHVSDSPYYVNVDGPLEVFTTESAVPLKSAFKNKNEGEKQESRKISFQVEESQVKCMKQEKKNKFKAKTAGKVIRRKLIRYIVKINGKDIPVNADNTQSLATELLKMDYDFETCPSFHRRNSWGFAGDAERKKSVIRQFCIDTKELDAQISQRRTRSLSLKPGSKKLLEKSDSFDSLSLELNCLNEDAYENDGNACENEEDYAYINEDMNALDETNEIKLDSSGETDSENNTFLSELTGSKFDKSLEDNSNDVTEDGKISSLSINKTQQEKVDRTEDDLYRNVLPCSSSLKCMLIRADKDDKLSINYQCTDKNLLNNCSELNDSIRNVNILYRSKIFRSNPKVNIYQKKIYKCSPKIAITEERFRNLIIKIFYKIISRKRNSTSLAPVVAYRKRKVNIKRKRIIKIKAEKFSEVFKNVQVSNTNSKFLLKPYFEYEKNASENISKDFSNENFHITPKITSKIKSGKNDNYEVKCPDSKNLKTDSGAFTIYRNVSQYPRGKDKEKFSQNIAEEPEVKRVAVKHKLNSSFNPSICSGMKTKDEIAILDLQRVPNLKPTRQITLNNNRKDTLSNLTQTEEKTSRISNPLRIHTLKPLGQFNFAQFNPPLNSENTSPVKSQIEHWENTLSPEKEYASPKKLHEASDTEQVSVKEKLAFWEYRTKESTENCSPGNNRKINLTVNKKSSLCVSDSLRNDDLQKSCSSGKNSNIPVVTVKEENVIFTNEETKSLTKAQIEDTISSDFQIESGKIRSLSFSDPVVSEAAKDKAENTSSFPSSESLRKEYPGSSCDGSMEDYDSDDSEDSGGDYLLHSTEDEYIDDEISERASEYWGDLSIVKNWKMPQCPASEHSSVDEEFFQNYNKRDKSYPEECIVFGIAVYYGYVAVKNRFQVFTGDAGFGNLSVSMQGLRRHEVSLISVTYLRNDIYEVTYQVMTVGYYLISIHWMDRDIPGSPFVCKVTF